MMELMKKCLMVFLIAGLIGPVILAKQGKDIKLPDPQMTGGRPLMEVLKTRKSSRSFDNRELSLQEVSNLLWSAFGINRPESGKRTAPSSMNRQEIEIYVAKKDGLYRYDAKANTLLRILGEDIRKATGKQDFVKDAPLNLVYVADYEKHGDMAEESKNFCSGANTGFIAQNVYLYCASTGLATVVRGMVDREKLHGIMKLKESQKITLAQTVGYSRK
jgi:SagB-type dehydrogenase family enzyme